MFVSLAVFGIGDERLASQRALTPVIRPSVSVPRSVALRCGGRQCPAAACGHQPRLPVNPASGVVPTPLSEVLSQAVESPGRPLDSSTRDTMECRFGQDFSRVRVHTDSQAARAAEAIDCKAFTIGHNVAFGAGQWSPETDEGRRLLSHELTHVLQQQAMITPLADAFEISRPDDPAEREADNIAAGFGDEVHIKSSSRRRIARQQTDEKARPHAPVLSPADPRVLDIIEGLDAARPGRDRSLTRTAKPRLPRDCLGCQTYGGALLLSSAKAREGTPS